MSIQQLAGKSNHNSLVETKVREEKKKNTLNPVFVLSTIALSPNEELLSNDKSFSMQSMFNTQKSENPVTKFTSFNLCQYLLFYRGVLSGNNLCKINVFK